MSGRGSRLAARFRKAVRDRQQARRSAEEEERRRTAAAEAARDQLLEEILAFSSEAGFLGARRSPEGITLTYEGRELRFSRVEDDPGRVVVSFDEMGSETHELYRQAELGELWVYRRRRRFNREDRVPLWDAGLEALLVRGLGLPEPGEEPPPEAPPSSRSL
jgi:hypothetical protein